MSKMLTNENIANSTKKSIFKKKAGDISRSSMEGIAQQPESSNTNKNNRIIAFSLV